MHKPLICRPISNDCYLSSYVLLIESLFTCLNIWCQDTRHTYSYQTLTSWYIPVKRYLILRRWPVLCFHLYYGSIRYKDIVHTQWTKYSSNNTRSTNININHSNRSNSLSFKLKLINSIGADFVGIVRNRALIRLMHKLISIKSECLTNNGFLQRM